jgi:hypothetical protein
MKHAWMGLIAIGVWSAAASGPDKPPAAANETPTPEAAKPGKATPEVRGVEDPRALIAQTYEAYRRSPDRPVPSPSYAYSDRLRALFDAYDAWQAGHQDLVGSLDFDWWMNAQDWEPVEPRLTESPDGPDRRTVTARFSIYGTPVVNHFRFIRVGTRWYLDDVVNGDGGAEGWVLSELLQHREE